MFGKGGRRVGAQERAVIADADAALSVDEPRGLGALAGAAGAEDVAWAPMPTDAGVEKKRRQPLPYELKVHDVKAHLKDRSTAVVDMRTVVDAPHDVLFELLADPHQHEHIFDAIESARAELVLEDGPVRRWRLDYRARWKFWRVGGVCDNRLWMTTDRDRGSVSFELREPGFLRKYEGTWTITGPHGKGPGCRTPQEEQQQSSYAVQPSSPSASSADAASSPRSFAVTPRSLSSSSFSSATTSSSSSGFDSVPSSSGGSGGSNSRRGLGSFFAAINNPFINNTTFTVHNPFQPFWNAPSASAASSPAGPGAGAIVPSMSPSAAVAASVPASVPVSVPRYPTTIVVHKSMSPKVAPPFPINQVLKGHACGQVNEMLEGLLFATARKIAETEGASDSSEACGGKQ